MVKVNLQGVPSSTVIGMAYDSDNSALFVLFKNRTMYQYANVPQEIVDAFEQEAKKVDPSIGKLFNKLVSSQKETFPYTLLFEAPLEVMEVLFEQKKQG